jgi:Domain of unknown function (DUF4262)
MCRVCEGFSIEDVTLLGATRIAAEGFGIQGVIGPGGDRDGTGSWTYTVGLLDAAGHPELIVAGLLPVDGSSLLSLLAGSVLKGEIYEIGDTIDLGEYVADVGAVHDIQYELDTFSTWYRMKDAGVLDADDLEAVQIRLPLEYFGARKSSQPELAQRRARVDVSV